jgi:hypothetical protein
LDAIVHYIDEHDGPEIPDVETFVKLTGMEPGQVARAVRALSPRFIKTQATLGGLMDLAIMGVTDEARQAVGQWPSPEAWVERLVQALREAAEHEPDPERKRRLRALAEGLGGFARDVAVGVLPGWFVSDLLRNRDSRSARDQSNEHHTAALGLLDRLLDAIQEPDGGRPVRGGLFWRRREVPGRNGSG